MSEKHRNNCQAQLEALLQQRILLLDGAMGTMIQSYKLEEADYRGERFADHRLRDVHLSGNVLLCPCSQCTLDQRHQFGSSVVYRHALL